MSRLLHAGFYRFQKQKSYFICMAVVFLYGTVVYISQYRNMLRYEYEVTLEPLLFNFLILMGIVTAVFVSLFTGTEYSDGTIRNKLMVGTERKDIYLSNFLLNAGGGILIMFLMYLFGFGAGIPLFGAPEMPTEILIQACIIGILLCVAFVSVYNMITMNLSSKTNAAVVCILLAFVLMFVTAGVFNALSQPELIDQMVSKDGEMILETVKNPNYLTGLKREIYQNVLDFVPQGQVYQIINGSFVSIPRMMLYSVIIIIGANVTGICLFQRKDIK